MSTHYYADGSTHNDHHKELNINGNITPDGLRQLARRFLDEEAEETEEATPRVPAEASATAEADPIPAPLDTAAARELWRLAQGQGWVDERLRPKLPSDNQAAVLADVMADALALSPRWAPFERLWGIKDLVHKHSQAKLYAYYDTLRDKMKFELN